MEEKKVTKPELLNELEDELAYHLDGGTSYRQDTTRYALSFAKTVPDIYVFFSRDDSYHRVRDYYPNLDEDRLKDVSKMLSVIVRDLHMKKNMSEELKAELAKRIKNRKPLSILKKLESSSE